MSGYTIFKATQSPSSVPQVVGNALPPVSNYLNKDTPYWLHTANSGGGGGGALNGTILNIQNGDNTIIASTDFTPGNSYGTSILDTEGAGELVNVIEWIPQGPRPYTQWDAHFPGNVFAPNLLNTITNFVTLSFTYGGSTYPTSPATGRILTETFTVPKSGVYLIQTVLSMNVNPESVVVGASDYAVIGLITPTGVPVVGASTTLKPWNMPGDITGADYGIQGSVQVNLVASTAYCLMFYVFNLSGTLSLGGASGGGSLKITQLC